MACNCGWVCRATDPLCEGTQLRHSGGSGGASTDPGDGWEPYVVNEQIRYRPSPSGLSSIFGSSSPPPPSHSAIHGRGR